MKQDPNPIAPTSIHTIRFAINGVPLNCDASMIPKLFVVYVAALRAEYYAGVDDSQNPGCFEEVFDQEIKHAIRHREEIEDWAKNSMDIYTEPADEIGVLLQRSPSTEAKP